MSAYGWMAAAVWREEREGRGGGSVISLNSPGCLNPPRRGELKEQVRHEEDDRGLSLPG